MKLGNSNNKDFEHKIVGIKLGWLLQRSLTKSRNPNTIYSPHHTILGLYEMTAHT